jgi:hypothetical protein
MGEKNVYKFRKCVKCKRSLTLDARGIKKHEEECDGEQD